MRAQRDQIIGESEAFHQMLEKVSSLARLDRPVLVIGERGAGKEMIAARLHYLSGRWEQPYLQVNCGALSESLLDAELFGSEAGAYTGSTKRRLGRFERAHRGTLFLDEIANTSQSVQEKLLRVIEYGQLERLGGQEMREVDVRVVAATNVNLKAWADEGKFRADLLDRLAFEVVRVPPLRERQEDILPLSQHFAKKMAAELGREVIGGFSARVEKQLLEYAWPGNIRELKNVVERAVFHSLDPRGVVDEVVLDPFQALLPDGVQLDRIVKPDSEAHSVGTFDLETAVNEFEERLILEKLEATNFHQGIAASDMGMTYHQLRGLLRKHQIDVKALKRQKYSNSR